jgi:ABC-type phosphate transport system substrate-binding protein
VASKSTVLSGRYPYTHSFYLLVSGEQKNTKFDFITFARSPKGQEIIVQQGLMSVC